MDDREAISEHLEPLVAGARARGVADAFELLGIDAILIDRIGRVVHSGRNVDRVLAPAVTIVDGRLLGCDAATNEALQGLIASVIGPSQQSGSGDETVIRQAGVAGGLRLRAIRYSAGEHDRYQLLRAVLAVTRDPP